MSSAEYTVIIGLEVHTQLKTDSKLFCGCSTEFGAAPNTQTCPVCLGLPGALPVMNRRAFELSVRTALALNCEIAEFTKWDRKQYYYPDLPKAYQISQFDLPFSSNGWLKIAADDPTAEPRTIRITRAHLEEDAGKNVHDESGRGGDSLVDLNRTGTPLLEIVSEPDLRSASEARRYLEELRTLLLFVGVSDCNMQEGSLRCDANINLHFHNADGSRTATPIVELKNMNSFRNVELAVEFEIRRQAKLFKETGLKLGDPGATKQTRGWDAERGTTFAQREKEESSDYRYFPDPDLVPVVLTREQIEEARTLLPETPAIRRERFQSQLGLTEYDAGVIIAQGPDVTEYFECVASLCGDGKIAANWVTQDILRDLNADELSLSEFPITAEILGSLLKWIKDDRLTTKSARDVYAELKSVSAAGNPIHASDVERIIHERKLEIIKDTGALLAAITAAIASKPEAAADVKAGKLAAVGPMIGMIMKQVAGADPKTVRAMLIETITNS
ncbi:MAG: Asp-tRNA(Asn)/Glu-tRNA(Gln) amidotransferase subunit GatB [Planctomycetaceae bacterium]|nr:Asp-tRNA(Asn)/Glu-tRNA(Gln) amidotransferase subunit GatB [Planctomycetaceae bacterium]